MLFLEIHFGAVHLRGRNQHVSRSKVYKLPAEPWKDRHCKQRPWHSVFIHVRQLDLCSKVNSAHTRGSIHIDEALLGNGSDQYLLNESRSVPLLVMISKLDLTLQSGKLVRLILGHRVRALQNCVSSLEWANTEPNVELPNQHPLLCQTAICHKKYQQRLTSNYDNLNAGTELFVSNSDTILRRLRNKLNFHCANRNAISLFLFFCLINGFLWNVEETRSAHIPQIRKICCLQSFDEGTYKAVILKFGEREQRQSHKGYFFQKITAFVVLNLEHKDPVRCHLPAKLSFVRSNIVMALTCSTIVICRAFCECGW